MINLISIALVLLGQASYKPLDVAATVQGEAGICSVNTMLTVAHIYERNTRMNGRQRPGKRALKIGLSWLNRPDPTQGQGHYIFNDRDMSKPNVWALKTKLKLSLLSVHHCAGDRWLFVYGKGD